MSNFKKIIYCLFIFSVFNYSGGVLAESYNEKKQDDYINEGVICQEIDGLNKILVPKVETRSNDSLDSDQRSLVQLPSQIQTTPQISEKDNTTKYLRLILLISVSVVGAIIFSPSLIRYLTIRSFASKDYTLSRGTQHIKQIKISLKILNKRIQEQTDKNNKLKYDIKEFEEAQSDRLYRTLSTHLIQTRLCEIEGIGPKLRNAIINEYTNATIDSLLYAYERVYGIGQQKQWAISSWVDMIRSRLSDLLKQDFPGKEKITNEYKPKINELKKQLDETTKRLISMHEIKNIASSEEKRLRKVRVSHFIKACKNSKDASLLVNEYLKGVFPEWSSMPEWFKVLVSEYEG